MITRRRLTTRYNLDRVLRIGNQTTRLRCYARPQCFQTAECDHGSAFV
jgi:hypothetical protein